MAEEKSTRSKKSLRTRYYTFVVYPESAPDAWETVLDDRHVSWVRSPLHDKDIDPNGKPKKPHWHVMLAFESTKSLEQANEISSTVNATVCQMVESPRALVRYFAHMDNPDKAQYDKRDIACHGGFDLEDMLKTSNQTKYDVLKEMLAYVVDADIIEYEDLVIYAMYNEPSWFEALADNCTYMVNAFIKSRRNRRDRENTQ